MSVKICLIVIFSMINFYKSLYFDLKQKKTRCLIEELYTSNMAMIKYTFIGLPESIEEQNKVLSNNIGIKVVFEDDHNDVIIDQVLDNKTGKLSMTAKNDGQYRICVTTGEFDTILKLKMNLVIMSDNMDEPNLESAVKSEEVHKIHGKVEKILKKGQKYSDRQHLLIKIEDKESKGIMKLQKTFYYMTIIQICIVIVLGIYQLYNLKNFLDKNVLNY